jgi:putative transcriptional regulator
LDERFVDKVLLSPVSGAPPIDAPPRPVGNRGAAAGAGSNAAMEPAPGLFLIATARLSDPNFQRSVVVLLEHDQAGSLGLIINRPLAMPLGDLWTEVPPALATATVAAEGGPVERQKGILIHGVPDLPGCQPVGLGLAIGGDLDALAMRWAGGADHLGPRLFLGHSGWAPGQLAAEIAEGAWLLRLGRLEAVLDPAASNGLWERLSAQRPGIPDPSVN